MPLAGEIDCHPDLENQHVRVPNERAHRDGVPRDMDPALFLRKYMDD